MNLHLFRYPTARSILKKHGWSLGRLSQPEVCDVLLQVRPMNAVERTCPTAATANYTRGEKWQPWPRNLDWYSTTWSPNESDGSDFSGCRDGVFCSLIRLTYIQRDLHVFIFPTKHPCSIKQGSSEERKLPPKRKPCTRRRSIVSQSVTSEKAWRSRQVELVE